MVPRNWVTEKLGPEGIDAILLGQGVDGYRPRPFLDRATWSDRRRRAREVVARAESPERALRLLAEDPGLLDGMVAAFRRRGRRFRWMGGSAVLAV